MIPKDDRVKFILSEIEIDNEISAINAIGIESPYAVSRRRSSSAAKTPSEISK